MNTAPTFDTLLNPGAPGTALIPLSSGTDLANAVALQDDGKIVVAGYSDDGSGTGNLEFSVARLLANGAPDPAFHGTGTLIIPRGSGLDVVNAVKIQADGKIVLAGANDTGSGSTTTVVRLTVDGQLDTSFGGTGKVQLQASAGSVLAMSSLAILPDGRMVLAGSAWNGTDEDFAVVRLNTDGSLDTSLGGTGQVMLSVGSSDDRALAVAVQPDGKILAAGYAYGDTGQDSALVRLHSDGSLDTGFNGTGKLVVPVSSRSDVAQGIALLPDGRIVLGGSSDGDFSLVRVLANGSLDTSLAGSGKLVIPVGVGRDSGKSVLLQDDGKIVLAGNSINGGSLDFSVVRLRADGSLDPSFNGTGKVFVSFGAGNDIATSASLQPDGAILIVGYANGGATGQDVAVARLRPDGTLDTGFNVASSLPAAALAYVENGSPVVLAPTVNVSDVELAALNAGTGNYAGASVTLARHAGANAQDLFSGSGSLSLDGRAAVLGGVGVGAVEQSGGSVRITFNANATQAVVNEVLRHIAYANTSDAPPAQVQLDWVFSDGNAGSQGTGGALSVTGSSVVTIAPVNDAPTGALTISGAVQVGKTLTVTSTLADADGIPASGTDAVHYQWLANGQPIAGATDTTLVITAALAGADVSVQALYTDLGGTHESLRSGTLHVLDATALTVSENNRAVTVVAITDALLGRAPKFSLSGEDASLFKISSAGLLQFKAAPDHETPMDADHDGLYNVAVTQTNAATGHAVTKAYQVGVALVPFDGSAGDDVLKATQGADVIDGKAGNDTLTGRGGVDTFHISAGHDLVLDFNAVGQALGQEVLQVEAGAGVTAQIKRTWTATDASFNFGEGLLYTAGHDVDLSAITTGNGWSVTNKGKTAVLTGSRFDDTLVGGGGKDVLSGGDGDDLLVSGKGPTLMTGGQGADTFRLNGVKGLATAHHITDFVSGQDRIELDGKVFKGLPSGQLTASQFGQTFAGTAAASLAYDKTTGELRFDPDGIGRKGSVVVALLDNHASLLATDLWVI